VPVIDVMAVQRRQELVAEAVAADRARQGDLGAEAPRGHRLVEAFAAEDSPHGRRVHGIAGAREVGHGGDQVVVQTARNSDPRDSSAPPIIRCLAPA